MRDYFLGGPLAHQQELGNLDKDLVVQALLGHRSARSLEEPRGNEILSLLALTERNDPLAEDVLRHLENWVSRPRSAPLASSRHSDPLASILTDDFLELCRLEATIARREWLFFLIAFLRVATTMWMLAHLRITTMVRDWVLSAALGKRYQRKTRCSMRSASATKDSFILRQRQLARSFNTSRPTCVPGLNSDSWLTKSGRRTKHASPLRREGQDVVV